MAGIADTITGRAQRRQESLALAAQNEQRALLKKQQDNLDKIEAGRMAVINGGGSGTRMFFEDETLLGKRAATLAR